jgi:two-component system, OmpR family, sensor histidine kinase BaeS
MTESGAAPSESPARRDTFALRLALGFLGVALAAVALLAGLTAVFASGDVHALVRSQRAELTTAIASAAAASWNRTSSWHGADLSPALELASRTGADAQIRDIRGKVVASSRDFAAEAGRPTFRAPAINDNMRVGEAIVRFSGGGGLAGADQTLEAALLRALATAAGLAALLALVTAYVVARRFARPVAHIISVTRAMGSGTRDVRVGQLNAPTELRELGTAFDQMADRLDRNEQLRRDLVADVAHELRTPVAVLQAGHEALLDGVAEPSPAELGSLRDEVLRLARMVGDLQTLSAADAAALQLARSRCDLAQIAEAAADSLAGRFEAADTVLERRLTPVDVLADPRWLHQLVTNLLTNALKYSPGGGRAIIEVRPAETDAVLRVTDFGIGIPAADMPHIFDRFWRGKQAAQTSGSGIGLAIAAELAAAHGGRLTASSEPGEGTEMTLTLPRA